MATQRTAEPPPPPIRQAVRWIAQLGGFLGRAGDGDLGPKLVGEDASL